MSLGILLIMHMVFLLVDEGGFNEFNIFPQLQVDENLLFDALVELLLKLFHGLSSCFLELVIHLNCYNKGHNSMANPTHVKTIVFN